MTPVAKPLPGPAPAAFQFFPQGALQDPEVHRLGAASPGAPAAVQSERAARIPSEAASQPARPPALTQGTSRAHGCPGGTQVTRTCVTALEEADQTSPLNRDRKPRSCFVSNGTCGQPTDTLTLAP